MIKTLLINSVVIFILASVMDGIKVKNFLTAVGVAIVLAIVNTILKPVIVLLTLPLTVITLGLFVWGINAWMVMLTEWVLACFKAHSLRCAIGISRLLTIL